MSKPLAPDISAPKLSPDQLFEKLKMLQPFCSVVQKRWDDQSIYTPTAEICFRVNGSSLVLTATNLEAYASYEIQSAGMPTGTAGICLPGKTITDWLNIHRTEGGEYLKMTCEQKERQVQNGVDKEKKPKYQTVYDAVAVLKYRKSQATVKGFHEDNFPGMPSLGVKLASVSAEKLFEAARYLHEMGKQIHKDNERAGKMFFTKSKEKSYAFVTDGTFLLTYELPFMIHENFCIESKYLLAASPLFQRTPRMTFYDRCFTLTDEGDKGAFSQTWYYQQYVSLGVPQIREIVAFKPSVWVDVDPQELRVVVKRCEAMENSANLIHFHVDRHVMGASSDYGATSTRLTSMEIEGTFPSVFISFNQGILARFLELVKSNISKYKFRIGMQTNHTPMIITQSLVPELYFMMMPMFTENSEYPEDLAVLLQEAVHV